MDNALLTQKTMEQEAKIAHQQADIEEIFRQQKKQDAKIEENSKMLTVIHELVVTMTEVKCGVQDLNERVEIIENDKRTKAHAVWQIIISAVIGGGLTLLITQLATKAFGG